MCGNFHSNFSEIGLVSLGLPILKWQPRFQSLYNIFQFACENERNKNAFHLHRSFFLSFLSSLILSICLSIFQLVFSKMLVISMKRFWHKR